MRNSAYLVKLEKKILDIGIKKGSTVIICADVLRFAIFLKRKTHKNPQLSFLVSATLSHKKQYERKTHHRSNAQPPQFS